MAHLTTIALTATADRFALRLETPGQVVYQARPSGQRYIREFGQQYYRWAGTVRIPRKQGEAAQAVQAWIQAMQGQRHYADIPIPFPTFAPTDADGNPDSTWDGAYTSKTVTTDGQLALSGVAKRSNLVVGHYAQLGTRLVQLVKVDTSGASTDVFTVNPDVDPAAGDKLAPATTLRARLIRPVDGPYHPDYMGPWTLTVEEYIG